jgi:hypothetical protein
MRSPAEQAQTLAATLKTQIQEKRASQGDTLAEFVELCLQAPECEPILQQTLADIKTLTENDIEKLRNFRTHRESLINRQALHPVTLLNEKFARLFALHSQEVLLLSNLLPLKIAERDDMNKLMAEAADALARANKHLLLWIRLGILSADNTQNAAAINTQLGVYLFHHGKPELGLQFLRDALVISQQRIASLQPAKLLGEFSATLLTYATNETKDNDRHRQISIILHTILQLCLTPQAYDWLPKLAACCYEVLTSIFKEPTAKKSHLATMICQFLEDHFGCFSFLKSSGLKHDFLDKINKGLWIVKYKNRPHWMTIALAYTQRPPALASDKLQENLRHCAMEDNLYAFLHSKKDKAPAQRKAALLFIAGQTLDYKLFGLFEVLLARQANLDRGFILQRDDYIPEAPEPVRPSDPTAPYELDRALLAQKLEVAAQATQTSSAQKPLALAATTPVTVQSQPIDEQVQNTYQTLITDLPALTRAEQEFKDAIRANGLDPRQAPVTSLLAPLAKLAPHFVSSVQTECQRSEEVILTGHHIVEEDTLLAILKSQATQFQVVLEALATLKTLETDPRNEHRQFCARFYLAELLYLHSDRYLPCDKYPLDWQTAMHELNLDCKRAFLIISGNIKNTELKSKAEFYLEAMKEQEILGQQLTEKISKFSAMAPAENLVLVQEIANAKIGKALKTGLLVKTAVLLMDQLVKMLALRVPSTHELQPLIEALVLTDNCLGHQQSISLLLPNLQRFIINQSAINKDFTFTTFISMVPESHRSQFVNDCFAALLQSHRDKAMSTPLGRVILQEFSDILNTTVNDTLLGFYPQETALLKQASARWRSLQTLVSLFPPTFDFNEKLIPMKQSFKNSSIRIDTLLMLSQLISSIQRTLEGEVKEQVEMCQHFAGGQLPLSIASSLHPSESVLMLCTSEQFLTHAEEMLGTHQKIQLMQQLAITLPTEVRPACELNLTYMGLCLSNAGNSPLAKSCLDAAISLRDQHLVLLSPTRVLGRLVEVLITAAATPSAQATANHELIAKVLQKIVLISQRTNNQDWAKMISASLLTTLATENIEARLATGLMQVFEELFNGYALTKALEPEHPALKNRNPITCPTLTPAQIAKYHTEPLPNLIPAQEHQALGERTTEAHLCRFLSLQTAAASQPSTLFSAALFKSAFTPVTLLTSLQHATPETKFSVFMKALMASSLAPAPQSIAEAVSVAPVATAIVPEDEKPQTAEEQAQDLVKTLLSELQQQPSAATVSDVLMRLSLLGPNQPEQASSATPAIRLGQLSYSLIRYATHDTSDPIRHQQVAKILRTILLICTTPPPATAWVPELITSMNAVLTEICEKSKHKSDLANLLCQFLENNFGYFSELKAQNLQHPFMLKISKEQWKVSLQQHREKIDLIPLFTEAPPTINNRGLREALRQTAVEKNLLDFLSSKADKPWREKLLAYQYYEQYRMLGLFEILLARHKNDSSFLLTKDDYQHTEFLAMQKLTGTESAVKIVPSEPQNTAIEPKATTPRDQSTITGRFFEVKPIPPGKEPKEFDNDYGL